MGVSLAERLCWRLGSLISEAWRLLLEMRMITETLKRPGSQERSSQDVKTSCCSSTPPFPQTSQQGAGRAPAIETSSQVVPKLPPALTWGDQVVVSALVQGTSVCSAVASVC